MINKCIRRFFERVEVKTLVSYLKLVNNPHDDLSLEVAISNPKRGFGPQSMVHLKSVRSDYLLSSVFIFIRYLFAARMTDTIDDLF